MVFCMGSSVLEQMIVLWCLCDDDGIIEQMIVLWCFVQAVVHRTNYCFVVCVLTVLS